MTYEIVSRMYVLLAFELHLEKSAEIKLRYDWLNRVAEDELSWSLSFKTDYHSSLSSIPGKRT